MQTELCVPLVLLCAVLVVGASVASSPLWCNLLLPRSGACRPPRRLAARLCACARSDDANHAIGGRRRQTRVCSATHCRRRTHFKPARTIPRRTRSRTQPRIAVVMRPSHQTIPGSSIYSGWRESRGETRDRMRWTARWRENKRHHRCPSRPRDPLTAASREPRAPQPLACSLLVPHPHAIVPSFAQLASPFILPRHGRRRSPQFRRGGQA